MVIEAEQLFEQFASFVALAIEVAAILAVAIGSVEAAVTASRQIFFEQATRSRRAIWVRYATWILLALEFTLGADIVRTVIAPSWNDIGQLAAIAAIRTALNYYLAKDIETAVEITGAAVAD